MKTIFRQTELYKFLMYCNSNSLEKVVLDCGAGGNCPPLALFAEHGYKTMGIELSESQLEESKKFAKEKGVELDILKGDIRELPFENEFISYVYSFNSIFHMTKSDIAKSVDEMKRVLKPGGLLYVNFLSTEDCGYGEGEAVGVGEYLQTEREEKVIHTYYELNEGDKHFEDMDILFKQHRIIERIFEGERIKQAYIDYIVYNK